MANHAILSASSSHRWLNCPPSARLCEAYEDKGSDYAAEGTDAHALCEFRLKQALEIPADDPIENLSWYNEEMEECASGYAAYVLELLAEADIFRPRVDDLRDLLVERPDTRFARVVGDHLLDHLRGDLQVLGRYAVRLELLGHEVFACDLHLVLEDVARDVDHLHAVPQRRVDVGDVVGRRDEQHLREVVLGVEVVDQPGNLNSLLKTLLETNIDIDYIYLSFNRESGCPIMVFHVPDVYETEASLKSKGYTVL